MNEKWDYRFLAMAREIASWSKDPSSKIGAIAVDDNRRILAAGYNGFNRHDADNIIDYYDRDVKYSKIIHAEKNLILNALNSGTSLNGATIYVHGLPVCKLCANELCQTGIKGVVCEWDQKNPSLDRWNEEWYGHSSACFDKGDITYKIYDRRDDSQDRIVAVENDSKDCILISKRGLTFELDPLKDDIEIEKVIKFHDKILSDV